MLVYNVLYYNKFQKKIFVVYASHHVQNSTLPVPGLASRFGCIRKKNYQSINVLNTSFKKDQVVYNKAKEGRWGPRLSKLQRARTKPTISSKELADKFYIGIERAKKTLDITTQKGIWASLDVTNRFKVQAWRNKRILRGKWYSNTMLFLVTSIV